MYKKAFEYEHNCKGETLQPDESPTIVETWLEMEKLLETGEYMRSPFPVRMISDFL